MSLGGFALLVAILALPSCALSVGCNYTMYDLFPNWDPSPWSCKDKCGVPYRGEPCACDSVCRIYGNCCEDFNTSCADMLQDDNATMIGPDMVECRSRSRLVTTCPSPPLQSLDLPVVFWGRRMARAEVEERCATPWEQAGDEDILQMLPVTDAASGHHFVNLYCLVCHGGKVEDAMFWTQDIIWNWKKITFLPKSLQEVQKLAREICAKPVALPPEGVIARHCLPQDIPEKSRCDCSDLREMCDTGPDSYIIGDFLLFRNPHCLRCRAVTEAQRGNRLEFSVPDMSSEALRRRNAFEFSMTMRYSAAGKTASEPATVQLSMEDNYKSASFGWLDMTCTVPLQINSSAPASPPPESSSMDSPCCSEQNSSNPASPCWPCQQGIAGFEELNVSSTDQGAVSGGKDDPVVVGEKTTKGPEEIPTSTHGNVADIEESLDTADRGRENSVAREPVTDCRQERCSSATPHINGVCRRDFKNAVVSVTMSCSNQSSASLPSNEDTRDMIQASKSIRDTLEAKLLQNLLRTDPDLSILATNVSWAPDKCFFNATTFLVMPTTSLVEKRNVQVARLFLELVYVAVTEVLEDELETVTEPLEVCLDLEKISYSMRARPRCVVKTMLHPRLSSAAGEGVAGEGEGGETGGEEGGGGREQVRQNLIVFVLCLFWTQWLARI